MKALDIAQQVVLYVIGAIAVVVALDGLLHLLEADREHLLVDAVGSVAARLTPAAMTDMFVEQSPVQTSLVVLIACGVAAALAIVVVRLIRIGVEAFTPVEQAPTPPGASPRPRPTQAQRDAERERMRLERERRQAVHESRDV
jgi:hypothetical protein